MFAEAKGAKKERKKNLSPDILARLSLMASFPQLYEPVRGEENANFRPVNVKF